ncbi:unnamed protein product [Arabidopsis halleri]
METKSSQYLSPWSPASTPPQIPVQAYIGSFVTMISYKDLRYEGILCFLNIQNSTLGLQNVICYGTEGRNNNGFPVRPYNKVYEYILFNGNNFKEIIVKPPTCGYCLAIGSTCSKACLATKPPLPIIVSPNNRSGAKILQQLPLISNENLIQPQAMTESSNAFSNSGGCDFEAMTKNFIQFDIWKEENIWVPSIYKEEENIWGPSKNKEEEIVWGFFKNKEEQNIWGPLKNKEEESAKPAYNIDGSSYMISRNPYEPIGRPCNPLGPIARPVKHTEVFGNYLQRGLQLQPPLSNFSSGYYMPC